MTIVLVVVAIGWAIFIGSIVKERMGTRSGDGVLSFRQQLTTLERRVGPRLGRPAPPPFAGIADPARASVRRPLSPEAMRRATRQAELRKRRRDVLFGLGGVFAFSLLLVLVAPGAITALACLVSAGLLGGYVYLLVQIEHAAAERRAKVRYLDQRRPAPVERAAPELLLQRSATN